MVKWPGLQRLNRLRLKGAPFVNILVAVSVWMMAGLSSLTLPETDCTLGPGEAAHLLHIE